MIKYETTVVSVGEMAAEFAADGVLIFFGSNAPEELHEFAVLTRDAELREVVQPGDRLEIDGSSYGVTAVGELANQNIAQLGHLVVKFNELTAVEMPGDVSVTSGPIPDLEAGMTVRITSGRD